MHKGCRDERPPVKCSGQPTPDFLPEPGLWKPPEKQVAVQDSMDGAAPMDVDVGSHHLLILRKSNIVIRLM